MTHANKSQERQRRAEHSLFALFLCSQRALDAVIANGATQLMTRHRQAGAQLTTRPDNRQLPIFAPLNEHS
jgi:hypothetical protein